MSQIKVDLIALADHDLEADLVAKYDYIYISPSYRIAQLYTLFRDAVCMWIVVCAVSFVIIGT